MKHISSLVMLSLVGSCCSRPASTADEIAEPAIAPNPTPASATSDGNAVEEPSGAPNERAAAPVNVTTPQGLAAAVCPAGPYPAPLSGPVRATLIADSEPTALDPTDTDFHLYEGPVWLEGALYFSDFETTPGFPSRIMRYVPGQGISVALEDAGTNGLGLDPSGTLIVGARHKSKSVVKFGAGFGSVADVATSYQGKAFNSPNDLVFRSDGNLYFTDPDFQAGEQKDQAKTRVYRVSPTGEVSVVDETIENPNGISLSPDEQALYVAGNLEQGYVKRYPISTDGSVGEGEIVLSPVAVPDGMVFDCAGNLYVTEHTGRRVRVLGRDGNELGEISDLPKNVTNVAFGGPERKTLYITLTGALAKVELPVPGLPY